MKLTCHCGQIKITVQTPPETLTDCNCSICRRYNGLWGYYLPDQVEIESKPTASQFYIWGDECVKFHRCTQCGCVTHYTTTVKVDPPKVGVNFCMAEPQEIQSIRVREFDGADSWTFLT